MIVTHHAVARYQERIAPHLTPAEARAAIEASERGINAAAGIGCRVVRDHRGAKLRLVGDTVTTVVMDERKRR